MSSSRFQWQRLYRPRENYTFKVLTEQNKLPTKNTGSGKVVPQKRMQRLPKINKIDGFHHHQTYLI